LTYSFGSSSRWAQAHCTVVQTLRFERTGSSLSQEKAASSSLRCAVRVIATSIIPAHLLHRIDSHLGCTKNVPNEESKHVTLVRIAEEPIIPLLELNRQARNLIRT
jgi:hypothetical protein